MTKEKICKFCGRPFAWRRKWQACWDEVKYCSSGCRAKDKRSIHGEYERAIMELLADRAPGATICPSEAARRVHEQDESWRAAMEDVRCAARRLARAGRVEILQRGKVTDPGAFRGPVRLRAKHK